MIEIDAFLCGFRFGSIGRHIIEIAFIFVACLGVIFGDSPPLVNLAIGYVLLSIVADVLYRERMCMLNSLLSTPELPTIIRNPGDIVNTDKLFHPFYAGGLLFLAIFKTIVAFVFAAEVRLNGFPRSEVLIMGIGTLAAMINTVTIFSEIAMLIIIGRRREHEFVSIITGLNFVEAKEGHRGFAAWKFVLAAAASQKPATPSVATATGA